MRVDARRERIGDQLGLGPLAEEEVRVGIDHRRAA